MRARTLGAAGLIALLALPGGAQAHGESIEVKKEEGGYAVTFYTFSFVTEDEFVVLGWNVTERASGERVEVPEPRVDMESLDARGNLVAREVVPLRQRVPGLLSGDFRMGPFGLMRFTLLLPGANVTFEQRVCRFTDEGDLLCEPREAAFPGAFAAGAMLLAALAKVAAAQRRRRRVA